MSKGKTTGDMWELPCYPNEEPHEGCRKICHISTDPFWGRGERGFYPFVGGCGIGPQITAEDAEHAIVAYLIGECTRRIHAAEDQIEYYEKMRAEIENGPTEDPLKKWRVA